MISNSSPPQASGLCMNCPPNPPHHFAQVLWQTNSSLQFLQFLHDIFDSIGSPMFTTFSYVILKYFKHIHVDSACVENYHIACFLFILPNCITCVKRNFRQVTPGFTRINSSQWFNQLDSTCMRYVTCVWMGGWSLRACREKNRYKH